MAANRNNSPITENTWFVFSAAVTRAYCATVRWWTLLPCVPGSKSAKVNITILADARNNNEKIYRVTSGSLSVSPNGKEVAFIFVVKYLLPVGWRCYQTHHNTPVGIGCEFFHGKENYLLQWTGWQVEYLWIHHWAERWTVFYASMIKETPVFENKNINTQPPVFSRWKRCVHRKSQSTAHYNVTKQTTVLTGDQLFAFVENDQYFQVDWWKMVAVWLCCSGKCSGRSLIGEYRW